jgi:excisionase family DNA binding protein
MTTPKLAVRQAEAARMLSIAESTLRAKIAAGEIPARRVGRAVLIRVADIEAWLGRDS